MKIPYDTSSIRTKMKNAFNGTAAKKPEDDLAKRKAGADAAKEREKRKALADQLANATTTAEERQKIIEGIQAERDATQAALEEANAKLEEMTPAATAWKKYNNKERAKLIETLPKEKRTKAQKMSDSLEDIEDFKEYIQGVGGKVGGTQTEGDNSKGTAKDWNAIVAGDPKKSEQENAAAIDSAIQADPEGFAKFMGERK